MFRAKKNYNFNKSNKRKSSFIFNDSNESSLDDCYNIKNNLNHLKVKKSKNVIALNIKTLPNYIPSMNTKLLKTDNMSNCNNLTIKKNKSNKIIDLNENNKEINKQKNKVKVSKKAKDNIDNKKNHSTRVMSKNSIKKNYFNIKNKFFENIVKNNKITTKNKVPININKFSFLDLKHKNKAAYINCSTPKNRIINKSKIVKFNNLSFDKNIYLNMKLNKKNISKSNSKNNLSTKYSYSKESIRRSEKIIGILNNSKDFKIKNNFLIISPYSMRSKRTTSSKKKINIINNKRIYSCGQKNKKKNILLNMSKNKYKNKIQNKIRYKSNGKKNLFEFNISTDYSSSPKRNKTHIIIQRIINPISLGFFNFTLNNYQKNNIIDKKNSANYNNYNLYKKKMNNNNYKKLLDNIQKRMKFLINNMDNYIELLKNEK
jgi:hypothetical protein